jgi:hypothetical protein
MELRPAEQKCTVSRPAKSKMRDMKTSLRRQEMYESASMYAVDV